MSDSYSPISSPRKLSGDSETFVERIQEVPAVSYAVDKASSLYSSAKNYNNFTKWSAQKIETPVLYVSGKTQQTFGPTLTKLDHYALKTFDVAESVYDANKDTLAKAVRPVKYATETISNAPNTVLTNAEKIVDTYLPPVKKGDSVRIQVVDTHELGSYKRAKRLTRTVYDRFKERIWILCLFAISLFIAVLRKFTDLIGSLLRFVLDCVLNFVRSPREFVSNLIGQGFVLFQYAIYLIFHPNRSIELLSSWIGTVRGRSQRFSKVGKERKREQRLTSDRPEKKNKTRYEKQLLKREDLPEVVVGSDKTD